MRSKTLASPRAESPMRSLTWFLLVVPLAALGQEAPGIDLSKPPPAASRPAPPPPPKEKAKVDSLESAVGVPGERDAALEDRVKAVQRKGFLRRHRLQLTALVSPTLNDAFFQKYAFGGRLAYWLEDGFAVAVSGNYFATARTDYVRLGARAFQSQLLASQLYGNAMVEGVWSPIYGKAAWLGSSIVHFDVFLLAGLGAAWSATSTAPRNEGAHLAADFGGGIRFYPNAWLALEIGVSATLYPDQKDKAVPATIQNVVMAGAGVSFFFPLGYEYVYP
jgi:outer membrane beta-barrel protein